VLGICERWCGLVGGQTLSHGQPVQSWHPLFRFSLGTRLFRQLPPMPRTTTALPILPPSPPFPPSPLTHVRPPRWGVIYFLPLPECPSHKEPECTKTLTRERTTCLRRRRAGAMVWYGMGSIRARARGGTTCQAKHEPARACEHERAAY
jgi:hypothetical protein